MFFALFPMSRNWTILDWNLRGINSQTRWNDIRQKIDESGCNVICFQETKRESFDHAYLHNFCPRRFSHFAFSPSIEVLVALSPSRMAIYSLGNVSAPPDFMLLLN
jgi:hypothetical protein